MNANYWCGERERMEKIAANLSRYSWELPEDIRDEYDQLDRDSYEASKHYNTLKHKVEKDQTDYGIRGLGLGVPVGAILGALGGRRASKWSGIASDGEKLFDPLTAREGMLGGGAFGAFVGGFSGMSLGDYLYPKLNKGILAERDQAKVTWDDAENHQDDYMKRHNILNDWE